MQPDPPGWQWGKSSGRLHILPPKLLAPGVAAPGWPSRERRQAQRGAGAMEQGDWDRAGLVGSFQDYRRAWQQTSSVLGRNMSPDASGSVSKIASPLGGLGRKLLKDTSIRWGEHVG